MRRRVCQRLITPGPCTRAPAGRRPLVAVVMLIELGEVVLALLLAAGCCCCCCCCLVAAAACARPACLSVPDLVSVLGVLAMRKLRARGEDEHREAALRGRSAGDRGRSPALRGRSVGRASPGRHDALLPFRLAQLREPCPRRSQRAAASRCQPRGHRAPPRLGQHWRERRRFESQVCSMRAEVRPADRGSGDQPNSGDESRYLDSERSDLPAPAALVLLSSSSR